MNSNLTGTLLSLKTSLSSLLIAPNPRQTLHTLTPVASLRDLPDPLQLGQKIMPYFSGLILLPTEVVFIAVPPCRFKKEYSWPFCLRIRQHCKEYSSLSLYLALIFFLVGL
jgi:hypothetical protein